MLKVFTKKCKIEALFMVMILLVSLLQPLEVFARMRYTSNVDVNSLPQAFKDKITGMPDWEDGFIDVTKPPYSAKGDGVTDDSDAIQNALNDSFFSNMAVYFPSGTYLVTRQIVCNQFSGPATLGPNSKGNSSRKFGYALIGSTTGPRPVIKLKDNSEVLSIPMTIYNPILDSNINVLRYPQNDNILLVFQYLDRNNPPTIYPPSLYAELIRNIDIDMGNNPDVSGISMAGAQTCTIEDVHVFGQAFNAGLCSLPGSGGGTVNVKVTGGKIGVLQNQYRPEPSIAGMELVGQSECGVKLLDTRGPLVLAGFKIISPENPLDTYRAIYANNPVRVTADDGGVANLTLVDGSIEVKGPNGKAIYNFAQDISINNVYVKADTIIESGFDTDTNPFGQNISTNKLMGDANAWKLVSEYYFASNIDNGYININGTEYGNQPQDVQVYEPLSDEAPPMDLVSRHIWGTMPSWYDTNTVSILDYGATRDDSSDDDALAIQAAIDDVTNPGSGNYGKTVLIPRGHFHIKSGIMLKKDLKMIGVVNAISVIHILEDWDFSNTDIALDSEDVQDGNLILSDFAIVAPMPSQVNGRGHLKDLAYFRLRSGNSTLRNLQITGLEDGATDNLFRKPWVIFSGNAGGKIYGVIEQDTSHPYLGNGNMNYEHSAVRIEGTRNPLHFYQFDVEHTRVSYQAVFDDVRNIYIYGFKYEPGDGILKIKDSDNINIYGGAGNYGLTSDNDESLLFIENSSNILITNQNRRPQKTEYKNKFWLQNGNSSLTDDYPMVVYKIGNAIPSMKIELIEDGGFENGIKGWSSRGSALLTTETVNVNLGDQSLKITGRASVEDGPSLDITNILVSEGMSVYDAEVWVKNSADTLSDISLVIRLKDSSGDHFYRREIQVANTNWYKLHESFDLKWSGTLEEAELYITHSSLAQSFYIDRCSFTKSKNAVIKTIAPRFMKDGSNTTDLSVDFNFNQNNVTSVTTGYERLIEGTDYTVAADQLILKKEYLQKYEYGYVTFYINFDKGFTRVLTVYVAPGDAVLTPDTVTFDKYITYSQDVDITVDIKDNTLLAVKNGEEILNEGLQYTVSGNVYTFKKWFLGLQPVGTTAITFDFELCNDQELLINIIDTAPPAINSVVNPQSSIYYKNFAMAPDLNFNVNFNGNTLMGIYNGSEQITSDRYSVFDNSVSINGNYISNLQDGVKSLTFDFSAGLDPIVLVEVRRDNLLQNGGFELGDVTPDFWGKIGSPTLALTAEDPYNGTKSLSVKGVQSAYPVQNIKGVLEQLGTNNTYYASAWVKNPNSTSISMSILCVLSSDLGTKYPSFREYIPENSSWTRLSGSINPKSFVSGTLNSAVMGIRVGTTTSTNFIIDDFTLAADGSISESAVDYDKNNPADIPVTINFNGNILNDIKNGTESLVIGRDYTVAGNVCTIMNSYLSEQPEGVANLTFDFADGEDRNLGVGIIDTTPITPSAVVPANSVFYKNFTNVPDLLFYVDFNGNSLEGIYIGDELLTADKYSVKESSISINGSYIQQQPDGILSLTFDFNKGDDPVAAIEVKRDNLIKNGDFELGDVTPEFWGKLGTPTLLLTESDPYSGTKSLSITGVVSSYPTQSIKSVLEQLGTSNPYYVSLWVKNPNSTVIPVSPLFVLNSSGSGTKYPTFKELIPENSSWTRISGTINPKSYISGTLNSAGIGIRTGNTTATNFFIDEVTLAADGIISEALIDYDKYLASDIPVTITFNGNILNDIKNGSDSLVMGRDYTVTGNVCTILSSYLAAQPEGTINLTFDFVDGADRNLVVNIFDTTPDMIAPVWANGYLTATGVTQTALTLSWNEAVDNTGTVAYAVYKDGSLLYVLGNVTTCNLDNLIPNKTYTFKVEAGDEAGNWSINGPKTAVTTLRMLEIDTIESHTVGEGKILSFTVSATGPNPESIVLTAAGLPDGAIFDPTSGVFTWTPGFDRAGDYNLCFKAFDGRLTSEKAIKISVLNTAANDLAVSISEAIQNLNTESNAISLLQQKLQDVTSSLDKNNYKLALVKAKVFIQEVKIQELKALTTEQVQEIFRKGIDLCLAINADSQGKYSSWVSMKADDVIEFLNDFKAE